MRPSLAALALASPFALAAPPLVAQGITISEIHYHPAPRDGVAEPLGEEFIELYNPGAAAVDLAGWQVDSGVSFTFPAVQVPAGGYLVVAADVATFTSLHPGVSPVVGGWTGRLSNQGERVSIADAAGTRVDSVSYFDEGDWALRERGPNDRGHQGWQWSQAHDGGGSSLELIDRLAPNEHGQNWAASPVAGGSPGAPNGVSGEDVRAAPFILGARHRPIIPQPGELVAVRCEVPAFFDDVTLTVHFRDDGEADFQSLPLHDNGVAPDGEAGDGTWAAELPARPDGTVVEFYFRAEDPLGNARTYPAPAGPGGEQVVNLLYQVDASHDRAAPWQPGALPVYRIIMTEEERAELEDIGDGGGNNEEESNAQMNATFISVDGVDTRVRYNVGVRNRGASSRQGPPNNHLVVFRHDDPWKGVFSVKVNSRFPQSQSIGSALFDLADIATADAHPVRLRVNGEDLSEDAIRMRGSYASVESYGTEFALNHFPRDAGGNLYQIRDDEGPQGDLRYLGQDPDDYRPTYDKQTNIDEDDWTDLMALTNALNNAPEESFLEEVEAVINLRQWLRMLAVDTLLNNREGGLVSGRGDDFALYRGVVDPRFHLVPHDLDSVLSIGRQENPDRDIFSYANVEGLRRLFENPHAVGLYYAQITELAQTVFRPEVVDPLVDDLLGYLSEDDRDTIKQFAAARREGALAQIPRGYTARSDLPDQGRFPRTTDGGGTFSGTLDALTTRRVRVNGRDAAVDVRDGTWTYTADPGDGFLFPGINRLTVQFLDAAGAERARRTIDIWNDTGSMTEVSGTLEPNAAEDGSVALVTRDSYLPGVPVLVRVELRNLADGSYRKDVWDATATLAASRPGVVLNPAQVRLYNGLGTALVTVSAAGGGDTGERQTLLARGADWKYLDDGSNQGTAWRAAAFDDAAWASGPAPLGYGDDDFQVTELNFGPDDNDKYATTYFRTTFEVDDPAAFASAEFNLRYDDAAAVYLNGTEVVRTDNLPGDAAFDDYADDDTPDEDAYFNFAFPANLLQAGTNTLAVEVHQGDGGSSDMTLDLDLIATTTGEPDPAADPGDFILSATVDGTLARKAMRSLVGEPVTTASGELPGNETTWSGVVRVTGDVTVPVGHTLTVEAGALVLLDGDPAPLGTDGRDIDVEGVISAEGTEDAPVTFTAADPAAPWGELHHADASGESLYRYANITRGGHAPRRGHTNTGPAFNIDGGRVVLDHTNVTDIAGKTMQADDTDLVVQHTVFSRSVMGPETQDTAVLLEDSYIIEMLGIYREDGRTDDDDGIYFHEQGGAGDITVRRLVLARTDDDGIDLLNPTITIEDSIVRDCVDKGVSAFSSDTTVRGLLSAGCDIAFSTKGSGNQTVPVSIDRSTLVGLSIGLQAENKDGEDPDVTVAYTVTNSIIQAPDAVRTDYDPADTVITYSAVGEEWPGEGNLTGDPLFVDAANFDFRLAPGSPAIDAGDPAAPADPDGTRADLGAFPVDQGGGDPAPGRGRGGGVAGAAGNGDGEGAEVNGPVAAAAPGTPVVFWAAADGPYHVTGDVVVPEGLTLRIEAGTSVFFDPGVALRVEGCIIADGGEDARIRMSSLPGAALVPDIRPGLPDAPPHWGGVQFVDSVHAENRLSYVDLAYAQTPDNDGSVGLLNSEAILEFMSFTGTHLRTVYTDTSSIIVRGCEFHQVFAENEGPDALNLDNISEHIKGEGGIPEDGHYIVQGNLFPPNKGHNDNIDVDSGFRPGGILQVVDNIFLGGGDENVDLGGDVWVSGNFFQKIFKDEENPDRGYANGISTGDAGADSTNMVVRNVFWDVDHAINLKRDAAAIFEYNTVVKIHPDFADRLGNPNVGSVINLFVEEPGAREGVGAHAEGNIFWDAPRVFGNADLPDEDTTSLLGLSYNLLSPALAASMVADRDGQLIDLGSGNLAGDPRFFDEAGGDFRLRPGSAARGAGRFGEDLGAFVPAGAMVAGEPPALTAANGATLTVGGPGIVAFRYRVNGGPWSADLPVGVGFDFTGETGTVRTAAIELTDLADGPYTVDVLGQDFAGNWQEEPTVSRTWTVDAALVRVVLNEVLAVNAGALEHGGTFPDYVELYNGGAGETDLSGWALSDDPADPLKYIIPAGTRIGAGEHLLLYADAAASPGLHLGFGLAAEGEALTLYDAAGQPVDALSFGLQLPDLSLGRSGRDEAWALNLPTPGAPNVVQPTGDPARVRINEWLASGDFLFREDFLELYNSDPLPVDLGGLYLTDDPAGWPDRHRLPEFSFIAGGGFRVLRPDGDTAAGNDHLAFQLSADGETIALLAPDLSPIDRVRYGSQTADVSRGRNVPGGSEMSYFPLPTPGLGARTTVTVTEVDLIALDDVWSYEDNGNDLGTAWREPDTFDDAAWPLGPGLIGFENGNLPVPIQTEVAIEDGKITYYFRHRFTFVGDPANTELDVSHVIDDGAVFFLNGVEVLRYNMASGDYDADTLANSVGNADLEGPFTIPSGSLRQGENVLAVEVHQNTSGSGDVVFGLELKATLTETSVEDDLSNELALIGGLRVTELMYHPEGNAPLEFIELFNAGTETVNLDGVRLTDGVTFTFGDIDLAPGAYLLVVEDVAAFEARYGAGLPVAGAYSGRLNNAGETLRLEGTFGAAILDFDYRDGWFPETDGLGPSLEIVDPSAGVRTWDDSSSWRPSGASGGSPGASSAAGISAGADLAIELPESAASLVATLGEGAPAAGDLTIAWTQLGGPGAAVFDAPDALATGVTLPDAPGAYLLRVTASDGAGFTAQDHLVILLLEPAAHWRSRHFSAAEQADPAVSGDDADPDRDGVPNLIEFALGLRPRDPDSGSLPHVGRDGGNLTLTYTLARVPGTEITVIAEVADTPAGPYSSAPGDVEVDNMGDDGTLLTLRARDASQPAPGQPRFIRLRIVRAAAP